MHHPSQSRQQAKSTPVHHHQMTSLYRVDININYLLHVLPRHSEWHCSIYPIGSKLMTSLSVHSQFLIPAWHLFYNGTDLLTGLFHTIALYKIQLNKEVYIQFNIMRNSIYINKLINILIAMIVVFKSVSGIIRNYKVCLVYSYFTINQSYIYQNQTVELKILTLSCHNRNNKNMQT